jgi:colicin import membrane protein
VVNTAPQPSPEPQPKPEPDPIKEPTPVPQPVAAPDPAPTPVETQPQQEVATEKPTDAPAQQVAPLPASRPAQLQKAPAKKTPEKDTKVAEVTPKKQDTPKKQTQQAQKQPDQQAKDAAQVAALINSEKSRGAVTGDGGEPTLGKNTGKSTPLSQSAIDGLIAKIKTCMSVPAGAAEAGITTQLHFSIDDSGAVTGMPDIISNSQTTLERALASAAQRAVMRCGPYPMAVGQEVQATFDPRELT